MRSIVVILAMLFASAVNLSSAEASRRSDSAGSGGEWWAASIRASSASASDEDRPSSRRARTSGRSNSKSERSSNADFGSNSSGVGPRPRQWCGWWMRTQRGGGPEYNLAWNWTRYGSPGSPQVGAVVVWRHHVGMITGQTSSGQWIVKSGNDGGQVRERARSISGAVIRV
jgi:hypothetical protein